MTRDDAAPDEFAFFIGGYMGPSYAIELRDGVLEYRAMGRGFEPLEPETPRDHPDDVAPADGPAWLAFFRVVERLGVWSWQERYEPTDVITDGTQWELRLRRGDRVVHASGSNAYPGSEGPEPSKAFRSFLRAVRKLVGGREVR